MADEVTPPRSGPKFAAGSAPKISVADGSAVDAPGTPVDAPAAAGATAAPRPSGPKIVGGPKMASGSPAMAGGPKMAAQSGAAMPAVPAKPAAPATTAKAAVATAAPVTASGPAALPKPANPNLVIQRPLTQIIASNAGNLRPQASGAAILGGIRVVENANTLNIPTGVTRREFLNYVWGASMALLLAESTALTLLFAFPRFRAGEFGGKIKTALADFPKQLGDPIANEVGKFWMVFTNAGLMAHYKICTHLGCIFKWDAAAKIFACPCHGSQFNYDGTYHAGPAPRGLDHFQFELLDAGEKVLYATTAGEPVDISKYPNAVFMNVNTGGKVTGIAR